MKFLSPEVTLYPYESTIRSCIEYCFYLELFVGHALNTAFTWNCLLSYRNGYAGLLVLYLLHHLHHLNLASLSIFCSYCFGRCSAEHAQLVLISYSQGSSTRYSDILHNFSVAMSGCYKDVYVNSFFPRTARLWNSLPVECFPLTYDLNDFKSRINRNLLTVVSL